MNKDIQLKIGEGLVDVYNGVPWHSEKKIKMFNSFQKVLSYSIKITQFNVGFIDDKMFFLFRGSDEHGDWFGKKGNFNCQLVQRDDEQPLTKKIKTDAKVHAGGYLAWLDVHDTIKGLIMEYRPNLVYFGGHSRGNFMAGFGAENMAYHFPMAKIYYMAMSSPRIGNAAFIKTLEAKVECFHYFIVGDIVPMTPFFCFGFRHITHEKGFFKLTWPPIAGPHYPFNVLEETRRYLA